LSQISIKISEYVLTRNFSAVLSTKVAVLSTRRRYLFGKSGVIL